MWEFRKSKSENPNETESVSSETHEYSLEPTIGTGDSISQSNTEKIIGWNSIITRINYCKTILYVLFIVNISLVCKYLLFSDYKEYECYMKI